MGLLNALLEQISFVCRGLSVPISLTQGLAKVLWCLSRTKWFAGRQRILPVSADVFVTLETSSEGRKHLQKVSAEEGPGRWTEMFLPGWSASVASLPLRLKRTQPWHLTALMSFLGIGAGAVKGLLNWGSETLPCETMYSGSQQWKLLPGPCGSAPRRPVVIHKHAPLLPCAAPAWPPPAPRWTWPFSLDLSELTRVVLMNKTIRWE